MTKAPRLPDFTRLSWPSHALEEQYGPVIRAASQTWQRLEWGSAGKIRPVALVHVEASTYPARVDEVRARGLVLEVIDTVGRPGRYSSTRTNPKPGEAFDFRCALGRPNDAGRLRRAVLAGADGEIGALLGFPSCCIAAFGRTWGAGSVDSTWAQYVKGKEPGTDYRLTREGARFDPCNIVPRWLGVRLVPHLPCSADCNATVAIGVKFDTLAREGEEAEGLAAIYKVLSWAWQWSGLHGIARVTFPVVRVTTRTDYTAEERVLEREGTRPEGTPSGLSWPFVRPKVLKVSDSKSAAAATAMTAEAAQRVADDTLTFPEPAANWGTVTGVAIGGDFIYRDNGFHSLEAMEAGHSTILDQLAGLEFDSVLDLGCGNGALLARIDAPRMLGIDHDRGRLGRAVSSTSKLLEGDLCDPEKWWPAVDVALVPLRRFLDLERPALETLKGLLRERARFAVFYLYDQNDQTTGRGIFLAEGLDRQWGSGRPFPEWTHGACLCRTLGTMTGATSLVELVRDGHLTTPGATP